MRPPAPEISGEREKGDMEVMVGERGSSEIKSCLKGWRALAERCIGHSASRGSQDEPDGIRVYYSTRDAKSACVPFKVSHGYP